MELHLAASVDNSNTNSWFSAKNHSVFIFWQWRIYIVKFWLRAPPAGPNSFKFMQFLGNFGKIICLRLPPMSWHPHLEGNPGSGTVWHVLSPVISASVNCGGSRISQSRGRQLKGESLTYCLAKICMQKKNFFYYVDLTLVKYDILAFNLPCAKKNKTVAVSRN